MEELSSTEVLDREILEDARKKAFKILKTADDNVSTQVKRWEKKTQKAIAGIRETYRERTAVMRTEILARDPLDKRRLRSETADFFLRQAMDEFLQSLKHADMIEILERELQEKLMQCSQEEIRQDEEPEIICLNLGKDEAGGMLQRILGGRGAEKNLHFRNWHISEKKDPAAVFPAIVINTENLKITASVDNAAKKLLSDKRAELASTLLGEGALND